MNSKLKMFTTLSVSIFAAYSLWWILLQTNNAPSNLDGDTFSDTYGILALIGGVGGIFVSRQWGGLKSLMGKSIMAFSLGLIAQALGQIVYSYYFFFLDREVPYPSLGDIGFFGSVLLYIYGIYCLAKVSGVKLSYKLFMSRIAAFIIPALILGVSYYIFLKDYEIDSSAVVMTFLDFAYPLGQALYISLAILTFMLSRKILGGIMKVPVLLILAALTIQYAADFSFLYRANREQWYAGDFSDYLYLSAYFLMSWAMITIGKAYRKVQG